MDSHIRCSADRRDACCRRSFAAAINKIDLAALLRSPAVAVQLAALRASNALSQHVETLPSATVPCIVRQLQSPAGDPQGSLCAPCLTTHWLVFCSCILIEITHVLIRIKHVS